MYSLGGSTSETLFLEMNFWRATKTGREILQCPIDNSCTGGDVFSSGGDSYCAEGHKGPLCAICDNDYFFDSQKNTCSRCNNAAKSQSMWSFLAVCVGLLALYGLLHERVIGTRSREILFGIFRRTKQKINITVIMMQIATSISDTLSISFPISFAEFLGLFNFVNINPFQVVAFECIGGYNYYDSKFSTFS